jgi:large subunit ribosomal protein L7/L12
MSKVEEILKMLEDMTVLELSELVKKCEEKFGVKASAPVVAGVAAPAGAPAEEEEEKTSFSLVLTNPGSNKIAVIKEIRAITDLGLKEAKDLVDSAPKVIKENISKEEAQEAKKKLEAAGATVELK